jgi:hypothetical protein
MGDEELAVAAKDLEERLGNRKCPEAKQMERRETRRARAAPPRT